MDPRDWFQLLPVILLSYVVVRQARELGRLKNQSPNLSLAIDAAFRAATLRKRDNGYYLNISYKPALLAEMLPQAERAIADGLLSPEEAAQTLADACRSDG